MTLRTACWLTRTASSCKWLAVLASCHNHCDSTGSHTHTGAYPPHTHTHTGAYPVTLTLNMSQAGTLIHFQVDTTYFDINHPRTLPGRHHTL